MNGPSRHISFTTAFDFSRTLRDPQHRQAMRDAGYDPGPGPESQMVTIACHPDEPVGEVMDRISAVEGDRPVFLAVRTNQGWAMLTVARPVRTTEVEL